MVNGLQPDSPWLACVDCGAPAWRERMYTNSAVEWRAFRCERCSVLRYKALPFAMLPLPRQGIFANPPS